MACPRRQELFRIVRIDSAADLHSPGICPERCQCLRPRSLIVLRTGRVQQDDMTASQAVSSI